MIELHIWGPAFGLPSIDALCLATVAYLRECLPSDQWKLVPGSPAENPLGELPALRDGQKWTAGFDNICQYLRHHCNAATDVDEHLETADAATCAAYTSFIISRGQPLLDLSLYVSSENYSTCTKPALGLLLPWPDSWFVPHRLRDKAKKRSEHLGLSGLDVDSAQSEVKEEGLAAQIPDSLKKPKQTVSALLGQETRKGKFRLDAVTTDFFAPLHELLGDGMWTIGDRPTSLDCLAAGYLVLMQDSAEGGQPWLRDALINKYPRLGKWAQGRRLEWFGKAISASSVLASRPEGHVLPWKEPSQRTPGQIVNSVARNLVELLPLTNTYLSPATVQYGSDSTAEDHGQKQKAVTRLRDRSLVQSQLIASTLSVGILTAVLFYKGLLHLPQLRPTKSSPRNFGAAGDFLGL